MAVAVDTTTSQDTAQARDGPQTLQPHTPPPVAPVQHKWLIKPIKYFGPRTFAFQRSS